MPPKVGTVTFCNLQSDIGISARESSHGLRRSTWKHQPGSPLSNTTYMSPLTVALTLTLSRSLNPSHSLTLTFTLTLSLSLSRSHSHFLSQSRSRTSTLTLTLPLARALT